MNEETELIASIMKRGIVETHYHIGPELLARRYDVVALAEIARASGSTIVLKNHTYPTTPLAALGRRRFGAELYGSIVLNGFVGGLSVDAIVAAWGANKADVRQVEPDRVPMVVWMPTVHAAAHIAVMGHAFDPRWSGCCSEAPAVDSADERPIEPVHCFDDELRPLPELLAVLDIVAELGVTLATGHLSALEVCALVPLALERGVARIILTHPHYPSIDLSDEDIGRLSADPRVFAEHCFAIHTIERVPLERIASAIKASPPRQVILSTDFGQIVSDPFPDGTMRFARIINSMLGEELGHEALLDMFTRNGRLALAPKRESLT